MSILAINTLIDLLILPSVALAIASQVFRISPANAPGYCHHGLTSALISVCFLSACGPFLPLFEIQILSTPIIQTFDQALGQTAILHLSWGRIALYVLFATYIFIFLITLQNHCTKYFWCRNVVRRASALNASELPIFEDQRAFNYLETKDVPYPFVWGASGQGKDASPYIVLPANWRNWPHKRLQRVLCHEVKHIERNDWLLKIILNAVACLFWFSPFVLGVIKSIFEYAEYACDDEVINSGNERSDYAEDILELSTDSHHASMFVSITSGNLSKRINLVLHGGRARDEVGNAQRVATQFCIALLLSPFFFIYLSPIPPDKAEETISFHLITSIDLEESTPREKTYFTPVRYLAQGPFESMRVLAPSSTPTYSVEQNKVSTAIEPNVEIIKPGAPEVSSRGFLPTVFQLPDYPLIAQKRGIEATVAVKFDVNTSGKLVNIRFGQEPMLHYFKKSIQKALNHSQYHVMYIDDIAIEMHDVEQIFSFKLTEGHL